MTLKEELRQYILNISDKAPLSAISENPMDLKRLNKVETKSEKTKKIQSRIRDLQRSKPAGYNSIITLLKNQLHMMNKSY